MFLIDSRKSRKCFTTVVGFASNFKEGWKVFPHCWMHRFDKRPSPVEKINCCRVQVRWEALQALCCAPPSDVLSCESWSSLRRNLCAALSDPDLGVSPFGRGETRNTTTNGRCAIATLAMVPLVSVTAMGRQGFCVLRCSKSQGPGPRWKSRFGSDGQG